MNITNLKADIDFLCGSTSATYADADKVRNMNIAYQDVATLVWESDGGWSYDDSNNTDAPIATRTVADASASYLVPTTALRIKGVEIQNSSNDWWKLKPITYHELTVSPENFFSSAGLPLYYQLEGNEIRLFPAPGTGSVTMSSGMRVYLSRDVSSIAVTATSTTPGFAAPYHRILSLAASIDYTEDENQRKFLVAQRARLQNGLVRFYSKRAEEFKTRIRPAGKKRWRNYV